MGEAANYMTLLIERIQIAKHRVPEALIQKLFKGRTNDEAPDKIHTENPKKIFF